MNTYSTERSRATWFSLAPPLTSPHHSLLICLPQCRVITITKTKKQQIICCSGYVACLFSVACKLSLLSAMSVPSPTALVTTTTATLAMVTVGASSGVHVYARNQTVISAVSGTRHCQHQSGPTNFLLLREKTLKICRQPPVASRQPPRTTVDLVLYGIVVIVALLFASPITWKQIIVYMVEDNRYTCAKRHSSRVISKASKLPKERNVIKREFQCLKSCKL